MEACEALDVDLGGRGARGDADDDGGAAATAAVARGYDALVVASHDPSLAAALIDAQAAQYGPNLLILMDALVEEFQSRGDENVVNRLKELRTYAASVVGEPTA